MATLESDELQSILETKLKCEIETSKGDHNFYLVNDNGKTIARTKVSKGSKHTLRDTMVSIMARQLGLGTSSNLVKFVKCKISKDEGMEIIRKNAASQGGRIIA